jgi:hypothetical protein
MGRTTCTEPQCLYKGALYLTFNVIGILVVFSILVLGLLRQRVVSNGSIFACSEVKIKVCNTPGFVYVMKRLFCLSAYSMIYLTPRQYSVVDHRTVG